MGAGFKEEGKPGDALILAVTCLPVALRVWIEAQHSLGVPAKQRRSWRGCMGKPPLPNCV